MQSVEFVMLYDEARASPKEDTHSTESSDLVNLIFPIFKGIKRQSYTQV